MPRVEPQANPLRYITAARGSRIAAASIAMLGAAALLLFTWSAIAGVVVTRTDESRVATYAAAEGDQVLATGRIEVAGDAVSIDVTAGDQSLAGLSTEQARAVAAVLIAMADDAAPGGDGGNDDQPADTSGGVSGSETGEAGTASPDDSGADPPAPSPGSDPVDPPSSTRGYARFAPIPGDTYRQQSGSAIRIGSGAMRVDHEVLFIAWSLDEARLVDEFAHVVAWGDASLPDDHDANARPKQIDNARLDALPPGRYEVQALPRDEYHRPAGPIDRYTITILAP